MKNKFSLPTDLSAIPFSQNGQSALTYERAERAYELAELSSFRDNLRVALVKQVMDNTAMLATAEAACLQLAPSGKDEYRLIVQAYARMALTEIAGGEL